MNEKTSQPILNLPRVVTGAILCLVAIHIGRTLLMTPAQLGIFDFRFSFNPLRLTTELDIFPYTGPIDTAISFLSYSFLHGDWGHLIVNSLWLAIFGAAIARRFGNTRFLIFCIGASIAGALAHWLAYWGQNAPMVGASAIVSGSMAAACRFVFNQGGPLALARQDDIEAYKQPATPLLEVFKGPAAGFIAVWFVINLLVGTDYVSFGDGSGAIAWQAHIGGFVFGLGFFSFFDPKHRNIHDEI
ncbi:MAG: rhomboid family intramembrane serine protease [Cohaesibacteraceae bacterium]|nr:rhomboid family intramembrane serine protease [Cohaesibacteraceae bacterium]MBL4876229.1 rhomboid family intramembrane serine protease [Cohaesibacteraceae bacterium]